MKPCLTCRHFITKMALTYDGLTESVMNCGKHTHPVTGENLSCNAARGLNDWPGPCGYGGKDYEIKEKEGEA